MNKMIIYNRRKGGYHYELIVIGINGTFSSHLRFQPGKGRKDFRKTKEKAAILK